MFFAPFERAMTARLFPRRILALFIFEIIRISRAPYFHILQLTLILALERRTNGLVGPVFIGNERFAEPGQIDEAGLISVEIGA